MVEPISSCDNSSTYYSEEQDDLLTPLPSLMDFETTKREEFSFAPHFQSNLRSLLISEENQKRAHDHYQKALRALKEVKEMMQGWEEKFAENLSAPANREEIENELLSLLATIRKEIDASLKIHPQHPGYYIISGVEQMLQGQILEAQKSFEKSAQIDPNFSDPENGLLPGDALSLSRICSEILNRKSTP